MASKEILVPDLGDFKDVAVVEVLVKPGDSVEVDAPSVVADRLQVFGEAVPGNWAGSVISACSNCSA